MSLKLLTGSEIIDKRDLITTPFPLINAVVLGMQEGRIFEINGNFFIIQKSGFSYFKTGEDFDDYDAVLNFLIHTKEIPGYFHVYDAPQKLIDVCNRNNASVTIKIRKRVQLKFSGLHLTTGSEDIPQGFYIKQITKESLPLLSVFNLDLGSKFWKSGDDFMQNGFGFCAFTSTGEPASICYSACIAAGVAEIDVATLRPFQQKKLAKKAVFEFVKYCIDNNITANWDCFEDNIGSLNTAFSVGFEGLLKYKFLSLFNKQREV